MLPWALYNLTPRDQAGAFIRPYHETQRTTKTAVTFDLHNYTFPKEQILLITWIHASIESTVQPQSCLIEHRDKSSVLHSEILTPHPLFPAGNVRFAVDHIGSPLMMVVPEDKFAITITLTASGNTTMRTTVNGVLIPRGTVAVT